MVICTSTSRSIYRMGTKCAPGKTYRIRGSRQSRMSPYSVWMSPYSVSPMDQTPPGAPVPTPYERITPSKIPNKVTMAVVRVAISCCEWPCLSARTAIAQIEDTAASPPPKTKHGRTINMNANTSPPVEAMAKSAQPTSVAPRLLYRTQMRA